MWSGLSLELELVYCLRDISRDRSMMNIERTIYLKCTHIELILKYDINIQKNNCTKHSTLYKQNVG